MRLDFLALVVKYTKEGGLLWALGSPRMLKVITVMLKGSRVRVRHVASLLAS